MPIVDSDWDGDGMTPLLVHHRSDSKFDIRCNFCKPTYNLLDVCVHTYGLDDEYEPCTCKYVINYTQIFVSVQGIPVSTEPQNSVFVVAVVSGTCTNETEYENVSTEKAANDLGIKNFTRTEFILTDDSNSNTRECVKKHLFNFDSRRSRRCNQFTSTMALQEEYSRMFTKLIEKYKTDA